MTDWRQGPVWRYPRAERNAPEHADREDRHGAVRDGITRELKRLMASAY